MFEGRKQEVCPAQNLQEARAVLADVANFSDRAIFEAANLIATYGDTVQERKRCFALVKVLEPLVST